MGSDILRIRREESMLLVIDLQEKFVPYLAHREGVLQAAGLLIETARVVGMPVLVTEHNPERIGPTVGEVDARLKKLEGYDLRRKDSFSVLGDPAIRKAIAAHPEIRTIVVAGCETHICVMQSSLDALSAGYRVCVVADGVSSRAVLDWERGLDRIERSGGCIVTSEMAAYELLGRSDSPEFKALLPVFKEWTKRAAPGAAPR